MELLICLVLVGIVSWFLFAHLNAQNRTYIIQDDVAEMQQNLRLAVQRVSTDLRMAGVGAPQWSIINDRNAGAWYNASNGWQPYAVSVNRIDTVGCLGPWASLGENAGAGATTITLAPGQGDKFPPDSDISIGGVENAKVTATKGDALTIDSDPSVEGNQPLRFAQPADTGVCRVMWMTYRVTSDNTFRMNQNTGAGGQPVANDIAAMGAVAVVRKGTRLDITFTAQTSRKSATGGVPITSTVANSIHLRSPL